MVSTIVGSGARPRQGKPHRIALVAFLGVFGILAMVFAIPSFAQTGQRSMNINGGTLTWTATFANGTCGQYPNLSSYSQYNYSNFVFTYSYPSSFNSGEEIPVTINLTGSVGYIYNSSGPPYCPSNGSQPANGIPLTDSTEFYRLWFTPTADGNGSASMESFEIGGVGPSFVILSVIYAPPGPGGTNSFGPSYVDYTNSSELGTATTMDNSFTQSSTYTASGGAFGISSILSSGFTQANDTSTTISVNKTTSVSDKYPGLYPATIAPGQNHDNDIVLVWLNPAINCTAEQAWSILPAPAAVQCLVYDPKMAPGDPDDPEMDIVQLPVGWLNEDYPMDQDVENILASHGITSADYATFLQADPYSACQGSTSCVQSTGVNSTRYDLDTKVGIVYFEPLGNSETYSADYETTSTLGQTATDSHTLSYTLSGTGNFENVWNETIKNQNSFTWTNKWSATTLSKVDQTAEVTINEPSGNYSGPTQFQVYKDNVYGTFMLYPTQ